MHIDTARLLVNINVSHGAFFKPGPLQSLITEFFNSIRGENWYQAERFFKKVWVKTMHLLVKKNKSGIEIPQIKTIIGLANNNDGLTYLTLPKWEDILPAPSKSSFSMNLTPRALLRPPNLERKGLQVRPDQKKGKLSLVIYPFLTTSKRVSSTRVLSRHLA